MTINVREQSLKNQFNAAGPNSLPDGFRIVKLGNILRALPTFLRKKNPDAVGTSPYDIATLDVLQLPDDAKALSIVRAYARAGTGTIGELAVPGFGSIPADGQVAVTPAGNLALLATSVYTDVDVIYQPDKYDLAELEFTVAANVMSLPLAFTTPGVVLLMEAEAITAGAGGKKIILEPGSGAPAAGQCRLNFAKTTVTFAAADAVTKARAKLAIVAAIDVDALLTNVGPIG